MATPMAMARKIHKVTVQENLVFSFRGRVRSRWQACLLCLVTEVTFYKVKAVGFDQISMPLSVITCMALELTPWVSILAL